jgi:glycine cleavage system aminomethyltransferase T
MENLGQPKQRLYGLRIPGEALPEAGSDIYPKPAEGEGNFDEPIGVITSSTLSPMLSAQAIAFAMLRTKDIKEGDAVMVMAEGLVTEATVGPVQFWSRQERD